MSALKAALAKEREDKEKLKKEIMMLKSINKSVVEKMYETKKLQKL